MSIFRPVFRTALIGGLALGTVAWIVKPERIAAGAEQLRSRMTSWIDENVDDPIIIRQQLQKLQTKYPEQIKDVRSTLTEVEAEIASLTRDNDVAQRVVEIARADLDTLSGLVDSARVQLASAGPEQPVLIAFQGRRLNVDQAFLTANRIKQTADNYESRLASNLRELSLLTAQRDRLTEQLTKLETEFAMFQNKRWEIERKIEFIERNEKLIVMLEEREEKINANDKWQIESLDQLSDRLVAIQTEHEAVLESLANRMHNADYEAQARGQAALERARLGDDSDASVIMYDEFPTMPIIIDEPAAPRSPEAEDISSIARAESRNDSRN